MPKASELLQQGRYEEIWKMCCGYLKLDIEQFMAIQKRLLTGQIRVLNRSRIGHKIMGGAYPLSLEEFRQAVPLTNYSDYCPELSEKQEDTLPCKPSFWVHTSGRTSEYACKWVPLSPSFIQEMSSILYGIGLLSGSSRWGDTRPFIGRPNMIYAVAPRPYISGAFASILQEQTPSHYYPSLAQAENMPFEERISLAFKEALSGGLDYFFGLSLVLAEVGNKFSQSAGNVNILPLLSQPRAMLRLTLGMIKSRMSNRNLLPRDLWQVKGIISSGLDSSVYRDKIMNCWGRYPLDIYANTEGGVIATQTWDYQGMTFIPNLNFLEFIPEKEHMIWQLDHNYQPQTVLLDEVKAGECYEIVITNFHAGSMIRYRIGDMIRITSLRNDNLGINLPQMVFERRADDLLDFNTVRLCEKTVWKAIETSGFPYQDWVAFKNPGESTLNLLIEPRNGHFIDEMEMASLLYDIIIKEEREPFGITRRNRDAFKDTDFKIKVTALPVGTFARYINLRRSEGADVAHLKPPHVNPPRKVLSVLLDDIVITHEPVVKVNHREKEDLVR
jgi:hypothetical protein